MEPQKSKFGNWLRNSITARMFVVGFLLLVLLIPLEFVKSLISERSYRQQEMVQETNAKWGNEVLLSGPIIKIPYTDYREIKTFDEQANRQVLTTESVVKFAYFFPENLKIKSYADVKPLKRGIYESVVFSADVEFEGNFPAIDFSKTDIKDENIMWDKTEVILQTSNVKGIKNTIQIRLNQHDLKLVSQYENTYLPSLKSENHIHFYEEGKLPSTFSLHMKIDGSESLKFVPIGNQTLVQMKSNWYSPSFDGEFLPDDNTKEITDNGFVANWSVNQLNRQLEQSFFGSLPELAQFAFGTNLIIPVDGYQKTDRTAKYGFMVIGLTLLVFLLIQISSKIYIHPFQFVMIGLALVMFYTLLLSISEHSSFLTAYIIAAISVLGLLTIYSKTILKGYKFPMLVCVSLSVLYGFIYIIIQLESYALLVGSIGMFVILAIVMFASRKIDWDNQN